jgi:hypothetical protein
MLIRLFGPMLSAFNDIVGIPLLGYGLGVGTNAGASLLNLTGLFLLSETEWPRIVLESGPVLGGCFILLRVVLTLWLGKRSFQSAAKGQILPVVLFGTCCLDLVSGQFGQTTIQGFTVLCAGLCLAAVARAERQPSAEAVGSTRVPPLPAAPSSGETI